MCAYYVQYGRASEKCCCREYSKQFVHVGEIAKERDSFAIRLALEKQTALRAFILNVKCLQFSGADILFLEKI